MRKSTVVVVILLFLLSSLIPIASSDTSNSKRVIYVDDDGGADYTKIQYAIDNASDGDTVYVYCGDYYENVVINKVINLTGEDKHTTVIDGDYNGNTVYVSCERVTIQGFTITGGGLKEDTFDFFIAGIKIKSSNCVIKDNLIKDNRQGVLGVRVSNLTISNNIFINDTITISCLSALEKSLPIILAILPSV